MKAFSRLVQDKCGASAAEYAMILAVIGGAIAAAAFFLGTEVAIAINDAGSCISSEGSDCV